MARGVNKVILVGHLGKDPDVRFNKDGGALCNISIVTEEAWKDRETGEKKKKTEWHKVVLFRKLGEIAGQFLKAGSKVYIEGSLHTRQWEDKDKTKRFTTEIVAKEMQMLDSKEHNEFAHQSAPKTEEISQIDYEEIPF